MVRTTANELDNAIATTLEALATRALVARNRGSRLDDPLNTFERSMRTDALDKETAAHITARLALYRTLVAAIKRLSSESLHPAQDRHEARVFAAEKTLTAEPKKLESARDRQSAH